MKCNFLKCFTDPHYVQKIERFKRMKDAAHLEILNDPVKLFYHKFPHKMNSVTINGVRNNILVVDEGQSFLGGDITKFYRIGENKDIKYLGMKLKEIFLKKGVIMRKTSRSKPTKNGFIDNITKRYYSPLNKLLCKETVSVENIRATRGSYIQKILSKNNTDYTKLK